MLIRTMMVQFQNNFIPPVLLYFLEETRTLVVLSVQLGEAKDPMLDKHVIRRGHRVVVSVSVTLILIFPVAGADSQLGVRWD